MKDKLSSAESQIRNPYLSFILHLDTSNFPSSYTRRLPIDPEGWDDEV